MKKAKDFYSKDVAEAIRQACAEFATSQEHLNIEVVATGSAGIFGLCKKRAHIRATLKQQASEAVKKPGKTKVEAPVVDSVDEKESEVSVETSEQVSEPEQKRSRKGREKVRSQQKSKKPEKVRTPPTELEPIEPPSEEVLASVKSDLDQVLQLMGFSFDISVKFESTSIQCQINGEDEESIVGSDGRILDSLQYLLRKMSSRELPDRMMIDLNAGDFRERREEELKKIAVELAEQVKADGKPQAIPALNPSERRVVHVTLQDDKSIRSRSVGDGLFKKVLIYKPGSKIKKTGGRRRGRQSGDSKDK